MGKGLPTEVWVVALATVVVTGAGAGIGLALLVHRLTWGRK